MSAITRLVLLYVVQSPSEDVHGLFAPHTGQVNAGPARSLLLATDGIRAASLRNSFGPPVTAPKPTSHTGPVASTRSDCNGKHRRNSPQATMKPYRELLPANASVADDADPAEASSTSSISSSKKRAPQTKVACSACRRKRTKCDGRRPVCSTCAATTRRSAEECEYDVDPDLTRTAALKKKNSDLLRRSRLLEQLFHLLTLRTEDESIAIIRRMRTTNLDEDIENLISFIKSGDLLIMFHSAESGSKDVEAANPAAAGDVDPGAARTSSDEATALLETL